MDGERHAFPCHVQGLPLTCSDCRSRVVLSPRLRQVTNLTHSSKSYDVVTNVVKTRDKDTMHVCDVRLK